MNSQRDGIAIIGLSVRLPGASNQRQLWDILRRGDYMVGEIPRERWHVDKYFSAQKEAHKYYCKWGGFLSGINGFEPRLFQLSPKEAASMDPQQRLVLLNVWNLLEDAGYAARFMPRNTGVYIANNSHDYAHFDIDAFMHHSIASRNSDHYQIANRVSYHFDFKGPSITIDNACAGSGTALHLACQALRAGDCEVAIAGGVNLILHPSRFMMYCALQFVAPEPFVRPFDARARGTLFAEGVTSVLLKPLRAAEADGDHIYGVVLGTAINAGGQVRGFTVPNPMQQAAVVGKAIAAAGIDAADIGYIEAHGTGTAIGDPLEIRGLTRAFGEHSTDTELQACAVGTIKSNIGHCESAAAIAGLSKILLQMKHATLVPSINIEQLNPALKLARTPFRIQQALEAWPERAGARYAGLSSFGAGGSNAHIVIRSYHAPSLPAPTNQPTLLLLSAHSESQLQRYLHDLVEALTAEPAALADIAHTLTFGRETLNLRLVVIADSTAQLIDSLRTRAAGQPSPRIFPQAAADQLRTPGDAIPAPIRAAAAHWLNTGETDETLLQYYTQGRKISLPGLPFDALKAYGLDNYLRFEKPLADHQNFIRSQTISPDSPLFTQHIVDQREVLPGAVLPCLVQRHLHDVSPDTLWALRVDWEAPIESELQETT
ncbi:MAG TPA: beta-ketoacyl synthase N-terminal-like domain-containing protein, partial [Rhodocyclaceae bacterium]|nr:beta-ketoacyl synthase N-terminal-like domain-containing protein [Rhodocyclaceae bacterium]